MRSAIESYPQGFVKVMTSKEHRQWDAERFTRALLVSGSADLRAVGVAPEALTEAEAEVWFTLAAARYYEHPFPQYEDLTDFAIDLVALVE